MRLDKYLKVSRLIKRRTVANDACDAGRVMINDKVAKASAEVKAGDIIEDRIILTDNVWHGENIPTEEELDSIVYDKGYAVRAIKIDLIDDIETRTDMTPYGFTKVDENRYCKTNEAIGWARMECYVNRLPKHKPTEEEMEFWME